MDVDSALFGALIGLPFGIAASAIAWWGVFHGFRPKLEWINSVEQVPAAGGVTDYAVAFRNIGKRSAVEVQTHARLRIRGLIRNRPHRWLVIEVPTNNTFMSSVDPFKHTGKRTSVVLLLTEIREGDLRRLPQGLSARVKTGDIGLRELLELGEEADLTLAATCADSFSGARHPSRSRPLTLADLETPPVDNPEPSRSEGDEEPPESNG